MSISSNEDHVQDQTLPNEEAPTSRTMLVTMVLLISGLLLTSTMMLYYASSRLKGLTGSDRDEEAGAPSKITMLFNKDSETLSAEDPISEKEVGGGSALGLNKLFGGRSDSVRWPKLELTGLGSSTDRRESFAIINRRQYHPGQLIGGKVTLLEVREHDVVVVYMGETNNLTVNINN